MGETWRVDLLPVVPGSGGTTCEHPAKELSVSLLREAGVSPATVRQVTRAQPLAEAVCWVLECPNCVVPLLAHRFAELEKLLTGLTDGRQGTGPVAVLADGRGAGLQGVTGPLGVWRLMRLLDLQEDDLFEAVAWDADSRVLEVAVRAAGDKGCVQRVLVLDEDRSTLAELLPVQVSALVRAIPGWCDSDIAAMTVAIRAECAGRADGRPDSSWGVNPRWNAAVALEPDMPADVAVVLERLCASAHQVPSIDELRALAGQVSSQPAHQGTHGPIHAGDRSSGSRVRRG